MSTAMTKWERVRAAIKCEETDRPCVALWKHFPVDDMSPQGLSKVVFTVLVLYLRFGLQLGWTAIYTP